MDVDWRKKKQCTYVQSEADNRICSVLIWLSLVERDQDQERVQSSKRAPFVQLHLADTRT